MSIWSDIADALGLAAENPTGSPVVGAAESATKATAQTAAAGLSDAGTSWLSGLGGDIASGVEGSLVSFLHDLWTVIVAPLAIITGIGLMILAFALFFKDEIAGAAAMAGELGMLA